MTPYRKRGSVVRWEHGVLVRVDEAGEAREVGEELLVSPIESEPRELLPAEGILEFVHSVVPRGSEGSGWQGGAQALLSRAAHPPRSLAPARDEGQVERLVVSEGIADHEYSDVHWREATRRVHLSLMHGTQRALLDFADYDEKTIRSVAETLSRIRGERAVSHLRLAPNVTAALLPSLLGVIELEQMPGDHDGYGAAIVRQRVAGTPPNWFRPTYRLRPIRAWHNLRAVPFGAIDRRAPLAIALLAPPENRSLRLLCVEGDDVFAATVGVTAVRAVGDAEGWYPYAAGAFGAEMLL